MFFPTYSINIIPLYIILLLYYESKNLNLFKFHLTITGVDTIDATGEDVKLSNDYATAAASYITTIYINYITVLIIILRIVSSFINNRSLISRSYMTSSADMSNVSHIITEIIKAAKDLNRTNIFSINSGSY